MSEELKLWDPIGEVFAGDRGFPALRFKDSDGRHCIVSTSSCIGNYDDAFERPGTSFLWFQAMDDGSNSGMLLNREQISGLIARLQEWLDFGVWNEFHMLEK